MQKRMFYEPHSAHSKLRGHGRKTPIALDLSTRWKNSPPPSGDWVIPGYGCGGKNLSLAWNQTLVVQLILLTELPISCYRS
jgi:hypothetical protein